MAETLARKHSVCTSLHTVRVCELLDPRTLATCWAVIFIIMGHNIGTFPEKTVSHLNCAFAMSPSNTKATIVSRGTPDSNLTRQSYRKIILIYVYKGHACICIFI